MDDPILLFAYGTLRLAAVQRALFGRRLAETPDMLPGYRLDTVTIADADVVAASGAAVHPIVRATGDARDRIAGAALELRRHELAAADAYETDAYRRTKVTLASGRQAFVYVGD